jgi:hypothetical protein
MVNRVISSAWHGLTLCHETFTMLFRAASPIMKTTLIECIPIRICDCNVINFKKKHLKIAKNANNKPQQRKLALGVAWINIE